MPHARRAVKTPKIGQYAATGRTPLKRLLNTAQTACHRTKIAHFVLPKNRPKMGLHIVLGIVLDTNFRPINTSLMYENSRFCSHKKKCKILLYSMLHFKYRHFTPQEGGGLFCPYDTHQPGLSNEPCLKRAQTVHNRCFLIPE